MASAYGAGVVAGASTREAGALVRREDEGGVSVLSHWRGGGLVLAIIVAVVVVWLGWPAHSQQQGPTWIHEVIYWEDLPEHLHIPAGGFRDSQGNPHPHMWYEYAERVCNHFGRQGAVCSWHMSPGLGMTFTIARPGNQRR